MVRGWDQAVAQRHVNQYYAESAVELCLQSIQTEPWLVNSLLNRLFVKWQFSTFYLQGGDE